MKSAGFYNFSTLRHIRVGERRMYEHEKHETCSGPKLS